MNAMQVKFLPIIGWVIALASCSHETVRPFNNSYHLDVMDNVAEQRFDISLKSEDDRHLCISKEDWPNTAGFFTVEKSDVFVESASGVFLAQSPLMSAYCPGGCGFHRIAPHGELQGFIEYTAFGNPAQFTSDADKELRFSVFPFYCREK